MPNFSSIFRATHFKHWIQCPECPAGFQLVSCLFRHSALVHYNMQLQKKYANSLPHLTQIPRHFQGKKLKGECTLCLESLNFRFEWDSNTQKKCETFIQHLGFKHRMILNHMPDEIFEEFKDILRADMQHKDKGLEIPCLACPQSTRNFMCTSTGLEILRTACSQCTTSKGLEISGPASPPCTNKFMCTSNYISHLIQKHYLERILSKYNPTPENVDCPVCKMSTPVNGDNGRIWLARHLVKKHGLIYEFAQEKVASQLRDLGVDQN
jgi:hypothetical protein